jgi:hypothetical protein
VPRPPHISPADWMELSDAERARWEEWNSLTDEERTRVLEREADAATEKAQPDGEIPAVAPQSSELEALDRILHELENIRFRLGVLVFWFVLLPILAGVVAWIVVSVST